MYKPYKKHLPIISNAVSGIALAVSVVFFMSFSNAASIYGSAHNEDTGEPLGQAARLPGAVEHSNGLFQNSRD